MKLNLGIKRDHLKKIKLDARTKDAAEKRMILEKFHSKEKYGSLKKMSKLDKLTMLCDFYYRGLKIYKDSRRISYKQALEHYSKQIFSELLNRGKYTTVLKVYEKYELTPNVLELMFSKHLYNRFAKEEIFISKKDLKSRNRLLDKISDIKHVSNPYYFIREYIRHSKFESKAVNRTLDNIISNFENKKKLIMSKL